MSEKKLENIVIILLIIVGVGLGIFFRVTGDNQLSSVLLAIALASILYKFLGGNEAENSLSIGVLKFGGSAAVLGGFIWLLSEVTFKENDPTSFEIFPAEDWYPADINTGKIKPIEIRYGGTIKKYPLNNATQTSIKNRQFELRSSDGKDFMLSPQNSPNDTLGHVFLNQIIGLPPSKKGDIVIEDDFQIFKLYPNMTDKAQLRFPNTQKLEKQLIQYRRQKNNFPFPFSIEVYGVSFEVTYRGETESHISDKEVKPKNIYFIPSLNGNGKNAYLVLILHANHQKDPITENYSEWAVCRVSLN